jgi:hypothetical protein
MKYLLCCCLGLMAATFLFTPGCDKDDDNDNNQPPSIFAAAVNDTAWRPTNVQATYYRNLQALYIRARDNSRVLLAGFTVDPAQPLKTYALEPLGNDIAYVGVGGKPCFSDINLADAGGSFILEKFDTTTGILTGKLLFKGYSEDRTKTALFETDTMQDINLRVSDTAFYGPDDTPLKKEVMKATLKGVNTVNWTLTDYFFRHHCGGPGSAVTKYELLLCSVIGEGSFGGRHIRFDISNKVTPGTYTIYPEKYPYAQCGGPVTGKLVIKNLEAPYHIISGQMNIIQIDTVSRNIKATFSMVARDTVHNETIEITNGEFDLKGYR